MQGAVPRNERGKGAGKGTAPDHDGEAAIQATQGHVRDQRAIFHAFIVA